MSLITEKYKYERLKRVEVDGKRRYAAPGHPPVASVTTILSGTKDMSHLIEWRKRVGEKKAQEITTEAAGVGTRMHKYLEDYIEFGEWPTAGSNPYAQQAHMMAHYFIRLTMTWRMAVLRHRRYLSHTIYKIHS